MKTQILAILKGLPARERDELVRELHQVIHIISKSRQKSAGADRRAAAEHSWKN